MLESIRHPHDETSRMEVEALDTLTRDGAVHAASRREYTDVGGDWERCDTDAVQTMDTEM